ncbi:MAG: nucleoside triphosphate pyrophosphatase [Alphaproteobacteria bacterium]
MWLKRRPNLPKPLHQVRATVIKLILASQSPRRKEILGGLLEGTGYTFTIQPAHVDETPLKRETPLAYVQRIAKAKALHVAAQNPGSVVIAADTPVIIGRRILQSPSTVEEARAMLKLTSNRRVHAPTAVVVVDAHGKAHAKLNENWIKFGTLSLADIDTYLANPANWKGIAGAIQVENHFMASRISAIHGSYSGILGLPLYETCLLLQRAGLKL